MANILEKHNLKKTKNREEILSIIKNANLPISAEEIYKVSVKKNFNINLSTVYRTLNTLEEKGVLLKQLRNDGISYFQENKHDHKHLFVCSNCTKSIVLDNCPLEDLLNSLEKQEGFEIKAHNIELYGLCKNCLGLKNQ